MSKALNNATPVSITPTSPPRQLGDDSTIGSGLSV